MAVPPLPEFERPPLQEVALGVQFEPLDKLKTAQLGLLWRKFREEFPHLEEQPPLEPVIERFGEPPRPPRRFRIEVTEPILTPRVLMLSSDGTELVQVQQDRFVHNWRKIEETQVYPRYDRRLRDAFGSALRDFEAFLREEDLGGLDVNQCEVSYINLVPLSDAPTLADAMVVLNYDGYGNFPPSPEDARLALRFVMADDSGNHLGRLHVSADPRIRLQDGALVHRIILTARGAPRGEGTEGIFQFLDLGREWIVRAFTALTTSRMHSKWGRGSP